MSLFRLFVLALALACAPLASATPSESQIKSLLPGQWQGTHTVEGLTLNGVSNYTADGLATHTGTIKGPSVDIAYTLKLTWNVQGNRLRMGVIESSNPDVVPVGRISTDTVTSIDGRALNTVDDNGLVMSWSRMPVRGR